MKKKYLSKNKIHKIISNDFFSKTNNISFQVETIELNSGELVKHGSINHPGSCMALPITKKGTLLILKQYRFSIDKYIYEFPSGKIESEETPDEAIKRELEEEAGVYPFNLTHIGNIYEAPSYSNEIIELYIARELKRSIKEKDKDEDIEVIEITFQKAKELVISGQIMDSASMSILYKATNFLNLEL